MDVLTELLPSSHLVKSEKTAKDRKQKPKYLKRNELSYRDEPKNKKEKLEVTDDAWDDDDRRSGDDRRLQKKNRGRFLDSREPKDRREQSKGIFVKI